MEIGDYEVVHVIKPFRLIDAESYEKVYWRRDGVALAEGYYVVSWKTPNRRRLFNEDAAFRGPFRTRVDALAAARQLKKRAAERHRSPAIVLDATGRVSR